MMTIVLVGIGCFLAGGLLGGVGVYVVNLKKWHAADIDMILDQIELIGSNTGKIHKNFQKAVVRFGQFAEQIETNTAQTAKQTGQIRQQVSKELSGAGEVLVTMNQAQTQMLEQVGQIKQTAEDTALNTQRVLERVKLMA